MKHLTNLTTITAKTDSNLISFCDVLVQIDPQEAGREGSSEAPRDPGTDLFLWAVLQNNRERAQIGWEQVIIVLSMHHGCMCVCVCVHTNEWYINICVCCQCKDCMCAALAASKILKKMAEEVKDAEEMEQMMELAKIYEKHAIGTLLP